MLLPVRTVPTRRVAVVWLLVPIGSPESEAPIGLTPPLSSPLGPVPRAGEPGRRVNQSRTICAWSHVARSVSESWGLYLSNGALVELPPPGPVQTKGMRLLLKVTIELVWLRTNFSAS